MEPMGKKQSFHKLAKMLHDNAPPEKREAFKSLMKSAKGDGGTGRKGDKHVVHVNDAELAMLHFMTDGGSVNPKTGMMEFNEGAESSVDDDAGAETDVGGNDGGSDDDIGDFMDSIRDDPNPGQIDDRAGNVSGAPGERDWSTARNAAATVAGLAGTAMGGVPGLILSAISMANTGYNVGDFLSRHGSPSDPPTGRGGQGNSRGRGGISAAANDQLGGQAKPAEAPVSALGTPEVRRKKAGRAASVLTGSKGVLGSAAVDRPSLRTSSLLG